MDGRDDSSTNPSSGTPGDGTYVEGDVLHGRRIWCQEGSSNPREAPGFRTGVCKPVKTSARRLVDKTTIDPPE